MTDKALTERVADAIQEIGVIRADKENKYDNYRYLSEAGTSVAAQKAIVNHRIAPRRITYTIDHYEMVPMKNGGQARQAVMCCTLWWGEDDYVQGFACGQDYGDKAVMKAQTGARREAWKARLSLPSDGDPEADDSAAGDRPADTAPPSNGGGDTKIAAPWDFEITFGKNKGTKLGDLTDASLGWYATDCNNEECRRHAQAEVKARANSEGPGKSK